MSKKLGLLSICLAVAGAVVLVNTVSAKTWFLPEYMEKLPNTYRKRTNDATAPTIAASECSKFKDSAGSPLLAPNEIPAGQICTSYPNAVINKNCVGNCKCDPSKFVYNTSNCSGDYQLGGTLCTDNMQRGTQCLCKTDVYPYVINGSSCKFADTSAGLCKDKPSNTTHYKKCYADTCWKFSSITLVDKGDASCIWGCPSYVDANCSKCNASNCYTDDCHLYDHPAVSSCKYGCKKTSSTNCTTKCAECYADNCRNRSDNKTEYGCDKYWDDCSTKCQTGTVCTPRDCKAEGYTQTSCPANADCGTPCEIGCGDTTKYYKYGTCNTGYIDLETYWCNGAVKCTWDGSFVPTEEVTCEGAECIGCSSTNKYWNGSTCSSSSTGAIGCYNSYTKAVVLAALDYYGGDYAASLQDCINQGTTMATVSDYATLASCGLVTDTHKGYTYLAKDLSEGSSCVSFTDTSIQPAVSCSSRYYLCSQSEF